MRRVARALAASLLIAAGAAQAADGDAAPSAVMVNGADGRTLGVATVVAVEGTTVHLVTAPSVLAEGACVLLRPGAPCHPAGAATALLGASGLAQFAVVVGADEHAAAAAGGGAVGNAAWFTGRSSLADWRRPVEPATIESTTPTGFIIRHKSLTPYDTGAPVEDATGAVAGVVAKVDADADEALVVTLATLAAALPDLVAAPASAPARSGPLAAAVAKAIVEARVVSAYSVYASAPEEDESSWPAGFRTTVAFSAYSLDGYVGGGSVVTVAQTMRTEIAASRPSLSIPLNPPLSANDIAVCLVHEVPAAPGRPIIDLSFWRTAPATATSTAPPIVGWAPAGEGDPCLAVLRDNEAAWGPVVRPAGTPAAEPDDEADAGDDEPSDWTVAAGGKAGRLVAATADRDGTSRLTVSCAAGASEAAVAVEGRRVDKEFASAGGTAPVSFASDAGRLEKATAARDPATGGWVFAATPGGPLLAAFGSGNRVVVRTGWGERLGEYSLRGASAALAALDERCFAGDPSLRAARARARLVDAFTKEAAQFCGMFQTAPHLSDRAVRDEGSAAAPRLVIDYRGVDCGGMQAAAVPMGGFCRIAADGVKCPVKRYVFRDGTYVEVGSTFE